jgi:membrane-associated phospholipid phosphatase
MYLGDHYPGDVVSGSLAGVLFAITFKWFFSRHRKTRQSGARRPQ